MSDVLPSRAGGRRTSRLVGRIGARFLTGRGGLAALSAAPRRFRLPLLRDGLDPVPALGERRSREPVSRLGRAMGRTVWLVTGYDEVRSVLADTGRFSTDIRPVLGTSGPTLGGLGFTDPPEHTRLRRLVAGYFTPRRLAALAPEIDRIVAHRLDVLADSGPVVDLVSDYALPVPFEVICALLGLDPDQWQDMARDGAARFDARRGGMGPLAAVTASFDSLLAAVRAQRDDPGPGLIGDLVRGAGADSDDEELARLVDGVFVGGYETSTSMIALGVLALLDDPAARAEVVEDPTGTAVADVVEELLRYLSVVQIAFPRFARTDLTVGEVDVAAGDVLLCSLSGANRDDVMGADPDELRPGRDAPTHVAFGHGLHRCVGAELARMELRAALPGLVRRFPDLRVAVPREHLAFRRLAIVHGLDALPVELAPVAVRTGG